MEHRARLSMFGMKGPAVPALAALSLVLAVAPGEDHESTKLKTLYQGLEFIFGK